VPRDEQEGRTGGFTRSLGLLEVTASGITIIVGAGIFVLIGPATAQAGALVWVSFLVAAALSALTALSYMELASMYPRAGSEFEFARQVFPPWIAFTVGWSMAAALVVAAATVAVGFARYAAYFVGADQRIVAGTVVVAATAATWRGMGSASRLIVPLAVLQVGGLVLIAAVGVPSLGEVDLLDGAGVGGVLGAAALVFFAYIGFDEVVTLAEETRNPRRTIPAALFLSLAVASAIYVAVAATAVSVLGPEALATSERPLADVVAGAIGDGATAAVTSLSMVTTFTTVILIVTAASRMVYSLAGEGFLPAALATVAGGRAPRNAIAAVAGSAVALTALGDLGVLASATDALVFATFVVTNVVLVVLRIKRPGAERPFRVPLSIGRVPVLPVVAFAATVALAGRLEPDAMLLAGGLAASGAVIGLVRRQRRGSGGAAR
jgi:APA family basic amino acid/polyamine antiporter